MKERMQLQADDELAKQKIKELEEASNLEAEKKR